MTTLVNLERQFQSYLLHSNQDIFQHVVSTSKIPADIRLAIYENAYRARLHEALVTNYPVLQNHLGSDPFEELSYAYIDENPSQYRSIRWFGDQLAHYLQHHRHYKEYTYLAELAAFEWTMALVFDAADCDVLQLEDMQHIAPNDWSTMRLSVHPSLHRLSLSSNVVQLWQAFNENMTPLEPSSSATKTEWVLWRKDLISQYSSIAKDEAWAIDAIISHLTFGELCEGLCQWVDEEDAGMRAASLLKGWITAGLLIKTTN